jgi:hypothetical protein
VLKAEASALTAYLAAQESGSDSLSGSLNVQLAAYLATREAGIDSATGLATVRVAAYLAALETGSDSFSANSQARVVVYLAAQEVGLDVLLAQISVATDGSNALHVTRRGDYPMAVAGEARSFGASRIIQGLSATRGTIQ